MIMEEKKLTDEEIVTALENCAKDKGCGKCPYKLKDIDCGIGQRNENDYLKLIQRLQKDYANLKERYVKVLDLNEKVIAEQKAEIERLKDENIEQRNIHFKNLCEYKDEIERLEKQVDELKTENKELYKEHTTLIAGSILKQQDIVKDTAQNALEEFICRLVNLRLVSTKGDLYVEMLEAKDDLLKEHYGVEVDYEN